MTRAEIITKFRSENPEITNRVISNATLYDWCEVADREICAFTRCIVSNEPTTITTEEDDTHWDLTSKISKFYDIDEYPGGGVAYNDKRIDEATVAELDEESSGWRTRSSGTPVKYYRRGKYLYVDRPINSNVYDITIYAVFISDDFDSNNKTPYNQLKHLEPFHDGINKYLQWRAMGKVGKEDEAKIAYTDYNSYVAWMKKQIQGGSHNTFYFTPPN